ncbi:hypothetical protein Acr_17g0000360 [Actinidia rufa]|uniref:Pectinesterase inhibitor domain-containing protein n=1 Tax=Actinidia rufa TaxID=165716 RepID=A0A7J0G0T5_9ERIC|nr:hypothetical protein Acr_17g0000360 [Actinidia rufa]
MAMQFRMLLLIISVSSLIFNLHGATANHETTPTPLNPAIKKICDATEYPEVCASSIVPYLNGHTDPASVLVMQVFAGMHTTEDAIKKAKKAKSKPAKTPYEAECLKSCLECYDSAMGSWKDALDAIKTKHGFDVANHLSAVSSMIQSCEDGFTNDDPTVTNTSLLAEIDQLIMNMNSNGLDIGKMAFPRD